MIEKTLDKAKTVFDDVEIYYKNENATRVQYGNGDLRNILANRISKASHYIGVDFCSCLFDQTHPNKAYELGQPGFFTIEGEAKPHLCRTSKKLNDQILENVMAPPDTVTANALDHQFHEVLGRYQKVMSDRKALLRKYPANEYPEK